MTSKTDEYLFIIRWSKIDSYRKAYDHKKLGLWIWWSRNYISSSWSHGCLIGDWLMIDSMFWKFGCLSDQCFSNAVLRFKMIIFCKDVLLWFVKPMLSFLWTYHKLWSEVVWYAKMLLKCGSQNMENWYALLTALFLATSVVSWFLGFLWWDFGVSLYEICSPYQDLCHIKTSQKIILFNRYHRPSIGPFCFWEIVSSLTIMCSLIFIESYFWNLETCPSWKLFIILHYTDKNF